MTLSEWQALLHKLYQGDPDTPGSSDDDYTLRTGLLEVSIRAWDDEEGVDWDELWKIDSSKTTNGSATTFDLSTITDFRGRLGGYIRLRNSSGNTYYRVLKNWKSEIYKNNTDKLCWLTGNDKTGWTLNFLSAPPTGYTIDIPYYKTVFVPSSATNIIEMSHPLFSIYYTLAKLHELDGEGDRATLALGMAQAELKSMKTQNAGVPPFQEGAVYDRDFEQGVQGFGN